MNSCLYVGTVHHRRLTPLPHDFRYRIFMMYLDLEELYEVFDGRWLWSARRPAPAWFRRADYLGDPMEPLAEAARDEAERQTGSRPEGPVRVLTHLRYFGYVINPATFYYCFAPDGKRVETILVEITNTPWNERHTYALSSAFQDGTPTGYRHRFGKAFHVSPFFDMDHSYEWQFSDPADRLKVHMENKSAGIKAFEATLDLEREEITTVSLARTLASHPWMTARVGAAIYWQAARLWIKGTPFYVHPSKRVT